MACAWGRLRGTDQADGRWMGRMGWDGLGWDVPQSGDLCRASCANPQLFCSALLCPANMLGSVDTSLPNCTQERS